MHTVPALPSTSVDFLSPVTRNDRRQKTAKPRHILVVDSHDPAWISSPSACPSNDWNIVWVSNAVEAYHAAARQPLDLAIVSSELPSESGWLVAAKLKFRITPPRIWLMASRFDRKEAKFASEVGAERYLSRENLPDCLAIELSGGDAFATSQNKTARRSECGIDLV